MIELTLHLLTNILCVSSAVGWVTCHIGITRDDKSHGERHVVYNLKIFLPTSHIIGRFLCHLAQMAKHLL